jgi:hypothetical protein
MGNRAEPSFRDRRSVLRAALSALGGGALTALGVANAGAAQAIDCDKECARRCSKSSRPRRCVKYCKLCCAKCQCVPSGTHGNEHECPCYRDMVDSNGKPKCP